MSLRGSGDAGQAGGIEALPFSLLVFVVGTLLVASAWSAVDLANTLTVATRDASRGLAEGDGSPTAEAGARRRAEEAVEGLGRDPDRLTVVIDGTGRGRCSRITVRASYRLPVVAVPWLGSVGPEVTVSRRHSELLDPYRSGLAGGARCAE